MHWIHTIVRGRVRGSVSHVEIGNDKKTIPVIFPMVWLTIQQLKENRDNSPVPFHVRAECGASDDRARWYRRRSKEPLYVSVSSDKFQENASVPQQK